MSHETDVRRVGALMEQAGTTFADEAGITVRDEPGPLYQLLVLAMLLAKPIPAGVAIAASRELFTAGMRTPSAMRATTWRQRVDALDRAHYTRYDDSTATRLDEMSAFVVERWRGDLRRLAAAAGSDIGVASRLLQETPGIGEVGASVFLREAQGVWVWVRPYFDDRVVLGAKEIGIAHTPAALTRLADEVSPGEHGDAVTRLASALVRVSVDKHLRESITAV